MIEKIRKMTAEEITDWLWDLLLNCDGMSKGDIYRLLMKGGGDNG